MSREFLGLTDICNLHVYLTDNRLEISNAGKNVFSLILKDHTKNLDKKVYMTLANGWEHGYTTAINHFEDFVKGVSKKGATLQ